MDSERVISGRKIVEVAGRIFPGQQELPILWVRREEVDISIVVR